jgi:hypothetical protein
MAYKEFSDKEGEQSALEQLEGGKMEARHNPKLSLDTQVPYPFKMQVRYTKESGSAFVVASEGAKEKANFVPIEGGGPAAVEYFDHLMSAAGRPFSSTAEIVPPVVVPPIIEPEVEKPPPRVAKEKTTVQRAAEEAKKGHRSPRGRKSSRPWASPGEEGYIIKPLPPILRGGAPPAFWGPYLGPHRNADLVARLFPDEPRGHYYYSYLF